MLGRGVADALASSPPEALVAPELVEIAHEADLFVLNLECCVSERGRPWPDPKKPFFFRAPPSATALLALLGADCVTLANNHALDFGEEALLDTCRYLAEAGIQWVGAGVDEDEARAGCVLEAGGYRLGVVAFADHPVDFAAGPGRPGIALADLRRGPVPEWIVRRIGAFDADAVLVTPHWGPNMTPAPVEHVRAAARELVAAGAALVAGHSAHVFHGVEGHVLYDLGDFLDDYAVSPGLRNDLGLFFLVDLDERGPARIEAIPLKLDYCRTGLATGEDAEWIHRRFSDACGELGTDVREQDGRLVLDW